MRHIVAGTRLVVRSPELWRFVVQPLVIGALAFIGMSVGAYFLIVPRLAASLGAHLGGFAGGAFAYIVTEGLYLFLLVLTAGFLYLTLTSFFSSSLWEKLSLKVEVIATGNIIETRLSIGEILGDSASRGLFACGIAIISICCGWTFLGLPAVLLAGFLGLHDYTAAAYLRRGITFSAQRHQIHRLPGRFGFALGAGLLTLLPLVNVLMLPCLVAGGTLMVIESEKANGRPFGA